MSEPVFNARSPGEMMRAAREKQGLHIAALAAAIKVSPRKLDALEHDRWDELPDATFVRALAQTVCRTLKIDAVPVLDLLPRAGGLALDTRGAGLNAPFRERPGRDEPGLSLSAVRPLVVAASVLMVAAVAVYFVPERFWAGKFSPSTASVAAPEVAAASQPASAGAVGAGADGTPVFAAPPVPPATAASTMPAETLQAQTASAASPAPAQPMPAPTAVQAPVATPAPALVSPVAVATTPATGAPQGLVQLSAREASWIEARDANGRSLLSRLVAAGERVGLDGALPIRLTIGNAAGTQLVFRGQPYELATATRDNVARVELK